jgi:hypothetical protein
LRGSSVRPASGELSHGTSFEEHEGARMRVI